VGEAEGKSSVGCHIMNAVTECTRTYVHHVQRTSSVFRKNILIYHPKEEIIWRKFSKTSHEISETGFYQPKSGKNCYNDDNKNEDENDLNAMCVILRILIAKSHHLFYKIICVI
jgi:hypothetical protein